MGLHLSPILYYICYPFYVTFVIHVMLHLSSLILLAIEYMFYYFIAFLLLLCYNMHDQTIAGVSNLLALPPNRTLGHAAESQSVQSLVGLYCPGQARYDLLALCLFIREDTMTRKPQRESKEEIMSLAGEDNGQNQGIVTYTEMEKAEAVAKLVAEGYPRVTGSLSAVSEQTGIPRATLKRWYLQLQSPPDPENVHSAKLELKSEIENVLKMAFPALRDMIKNKRLSGKDLITAINSLSDKWMLLNGLATERSETSISDWRTKAREMGIPEESVIAYAKKKFEAALQLPTTKEERRHDLPS